MSPHLSGPGSQRAWASLFVPREGGLEGLLVIGVSAVGVLGHLLHPEGPAVGMRRGGLGYWGRCKEKKGAFGRESTLMGLEFLQRFQAGKRGARGRSRPWIPGCGRSQKGEDGLSNPRTECAEGAGLGASPLPNQLLPVNSSPGPAPGF